MFGEDAYEIPMRGLMYIVRATVALGTLALLIPIGILFLVELTKAQAFGVVVACTAIFMMAILSTEEMSMHKAMLSGCALIAFLANTMGQLAMPGSCPPS